MWKRGKGVSEKNKRQKRRRDRLISQNHNQTRSDQVSSATGPLESDAHGMAKS